MIAQLGFWSDDLEPRSQSVLYTSVWWVSPSITRMGSGPMGLGEMSFEVEGSVHGNQRKYWLSYWRAREAAGAAGWWGGESTPKS